MYIDSHTHFDVLMEELQCTENDIINSLKENGISRAVQISVDTAGFQWCRDFAARNRDNGIYFSTGIHPSSPAGKENLEIMDTFLEGLAGSDDMKLLLGIGECGLDYYRMRQEKQIQIESFEHQLHLAGKYNRPVIVHSREAWKDTMDILSRMKPLRGIMHCFPGDAAMAREALELDFFISFAGNVTYKNARELHEAAAWVPSDRLLVETDAPFLAPVPKRGKTNRPEYIIHTYEFIAELRKTDPEEIREAVYRNLAGIINENNGIK